MEGETLMANLVRRYALHYTEGHGARFAADGQQTHPLPLKTTTLCPFRIRIHKNVGAARGRAQKSNVFPLARADGGIIGPSKRHFILARALVQPSRRPNA